MRTAWDYVIVGAGSAGATLASRLSEAPNQRVLLLEAGGWDISPRLRVPGLVEGVIADRRVNWAYAGDPDPSLEGRSLTWAAGRVVGGSSTINGMVYGRGLPQDYDRWVGAGNPGWGWDDLVPYFLRMEHWTGPRAARRGADGPLWVRRFEDTNVACAATMEALAALGAPLVDDYCAGLAEGMALTQATQKHGWRHSVASAYLAPARRRRNLTVTVDALALRLLFEGSRCVGVKIRRHGADTDVRAAREVIVCAGAIASPRLLMLSGVGPADSLRSHGLEVVHDLPGVGEGLNDHVNVLLSAFVEAPTYNTARRGWRAVGAAARFALRGDGPVSSPANHVQAFLRTDPGAGVADVQLQVMPFGFGTREQMARDGLTVVVSPCHPVARGRVRLRSADPTAPPGISMAVLGVEADRQTLLRGARLAYAALIEGPGRTLGGRVYAPEREPRDDDAWFAFFRRTAGLNWHPTSTCRMGPGPDDVVDARLRVHGLEGLRVVDASIMPCVTSGNTNGPVIAIAERAADLIAEDNP
jgi:choline dehydrogenase